MSRHRPKRGRKCKIIKMLQKPYHSTRGWKTKFMTCHKQFESKKWPRYAQYKIKKSTFRPIFSEVSLKIVFNLSRVAPIDAGLPNLDFDVSNSIWILQITAGEPIQNKIFDFSTLFLNFFSQNRFESVKKLTKAARSGREWLEVVAIGCQWLGVLKSGVTRRNTV